LYLPSTQQSRPDAPKEEVVMAGLGGLLHDIGKIKIATDIINNPDKLSDEEFAIS
jgi:HD-GYP domain-containing protein (c-di-GMP phosphodiesterase class II)